MRSAAAHLNCELKFDKVPVGWASRPHKKHDLNAEQLTPTIDAIHPLTDDCLFKFRYKLMQGLFKNYLIGQLKYPSITMSLTGSRDIATTFASCLSPVDIGEYLTENFTDIATIENVPRIVGILPIELTSNITAWRYIRRIKGNIVATDTYIAG